MAGAHLYHKRAMPRFADFALKAGREKPGALHEEALGPASPCTSVFIGKLCDAQIRRTSGTSVPGLGLALPVPATTENNLIIAGHPRPEFEPLNRKVTCRASVNAIVPNKAAIVRH